MWKAFSTSTVFVSCGSRETLSHALQMSGEAWRRSRILPAINVVLVFAGVIVVLVVGAVVAKQLFQLYFKLSS